MALPQVHPRRRASNNSHPTPSLIHSAGHVNVGVSSTLPPAHALRKGATFHSSTVLSSDDDPILHISLLPRRSPTCAKDLENILAEGQDHDRIANIIGAVDRSLSGLQGFVTNESSTLAREGIPVPRFLVEARVDEKVAMDIDATNPPAPAPRKHHSSDSGIASSTSGSEQSTFGHDTPTKQAPLNTNKVDKVSSSSRTGGVRTGINGLSVPSIDYTKSQNILSEYACRQIQKYIILPIIREQRLKDFHPLVSGLPFRVARKEITCLRDLEKVLLWLAPKWSTSKNLFIDFCETTIQCLHTTVNHLNERDQRRPSDRPYTNGYFLDLEQQVRQYAIILSTERARMTSNHSHETSRDEKLTLTGGLGSTGRPAEFVRIKDGRSISMRTGEELCTESSSASLKRTAEDSEDEASRSMARRKKSDGPVVKELQRCRDCKKEFKRPCDLTKHEKTHTRPWKCSEENCKYHEYGWPTEKERDRHVNDKHSTTPNMYRCKFHPCPYESKRESNCKQHMEKAHNWAYVRSKNNGKQSKKTNGEAQTPATPSLSTPDSNIFNASTPDFSENAVYDASSNPLNFNSPPIITPFTPSIDGMNIADTFGPFDTHFTWAESDSTSNTASRVQQSSWDSDSAITSSTTNPSPFETTLQYGDGSLFGSDFDWANMNHDMQSWNVQTFTPASSVGHGPLDPFSRHPSLSTGQDICGQSSSISPGARADTMLCSPYSSLEHDFENDEGYSEIVREVERPSGDFPLFSTMIHDSAPRFSTQEMFPDLAMMSTTWAQPQSEVAMELDGLME